MRAATALAAILFIILAIAVPVLAQESGSVTGTVTAGGNRAAVPDATVTLFVIDGMEEYTADVPNNPQLTTNYSNNIVGVYAFYDVPPGKYKVRAEKSGYYFFTIIDIVGGTSTANVVLPGYYESETAPTPSPSPIKTYYSYVPVTVNTPYPEVARTPFIGLTGLLLCMIAATALFRKRE